MNKALFKNSYLGAPAVVFVAIFIMFHGYVLGSGYFSQLSRAFVEGRVYLAYVHPKILALPNPYDAGAMTHEEAIRYGRIHDGVLFKDKWYLYHGPLNAVILMPFTAVRIYINDNWLVLFWSIVFSGAAAGIMFSTMRILKSLPKNYENQVQDVSSLIPYFYLGICLNLGILSCLGRPLFYEAAISAGAALFALGFCQILRCVSCAGQITFEPRPFILAAASACFAASVAARWNYALPVTALGSLILVMIVWRQEKGVWIPVVSFCGPATLTIIAIAFYNWERFGSPFETGVQFLAGGFSSNVDNFAWGNIETNFHAYFLSLSWFGPPNFPHFQLSGMPYEGIWRRSTNWISEGSISLFVLTPVLMLSVCILLGIGLVRVSLKLGYGNYLRRDTNDISKLFFVIAGVGGAIFVLQIIPLLLLSGVNIRYYADFLPFAWIFSAFLILGMLVHDITSPAMTRVAVALVKMFCFVGILSTLIITTIQYGHPTY